MSSFTAQREESGEEISAQSFLGEENIGADWGACEEDEDEGGDWETAEPNEGGEEFLGRAERVIRECSRGSYNSDGTREWEEDEEEDDEQDCEEDYDDPFDHRHHQHHHHQHHRQGSLHQKDDAGDISLLFSKIRLHEHAFNPPPSGFACAVGDDTKAVGANRKGNRGGGPRSDRRHEEHPDSSRNSKANDCSASSAAEVPPKIDREIVEAALPSLSPARGPSSPIPYYMDDACYSRSQQVTLEAEFKMYSVLPIYAVDDAAAIAAPAPVQE